VGRIGSGVRVSDSFHILSCPVICAVVRSVFRDTPDRSILVKYPLGYAIIYADVDV